MIEIQNYDIKSHNYGISHNYETSRLWVKKLQLWDRKLKLWHK